MGGGPGRKQWRTACCEVLPRRCGRRAGSGWCHKWPSWGRGGFLTRAPYTATAAHSPSCCVSPRTEARGPNPRGKPVRAQHAATTAPRAPSRPRSIKIRIYNTSLFLVVGGIIRECRMLEMHAVTPRIAYVALISSWFQGGRRVFYCANRWNGVCCDWKRCRIACPRAYIHNELHVLAPNFLRGATSLWSLSEYELRCTSLLFLPHVIR